VILEAKNIRKHFGGMQVLLDTWIQAETGRITGMIGPNGAGKSTFLAVLSKFIEPEKGIIRLRGTDVTRAKPYQIARAQMVRTFQIPREFARLTVLENLLVAPKGQIGESVFGAWLRWRQIAKQEAQAMEKADAVIGFLNLHAVRNLPAGQLSGGQKKLLELGRALMLDPQVLLLDEPFAGVNPALIDEIIDKLFALRDRGLCLVVVEHNMYTIRTLCDDLFVLVDGSILTSGAPESVLEDSRVLEAYLGKEHGPTA
jgi:ABC-type branched-subunit amino acid transport system ATPase component